MDERMDRLMAEAREFLKTSDYSASAQKFLELGLAHKNQGSDVEAEQAFSQAWAHFCRASETQRSAKQYRNSADSLVQASSVADLLGKNEDASRSTRQAAEDLLLAANEYLVWGEFDRASLCATVACFLYFKLGDNERVLQIYLDFEPKIKGKSTSAYPLESLYAAGYFYEALRDTDADSLIKAQDAVRNHLIPGLAHTKLTQFQPLITEALDSIVFHFKNQVKLPKITPTFQYPQDMVVNTMYDISLRITNDGEGAASALNATISASAPVEIIDGQTVMEFADFEPGKEVSTSLRIRVLADIEDEIIVPVEAVVAFSDVLGSRQSMYVGPLNLVFRARSLKGELQEKVDGTHSLLASTEERVVVAADNQHLSSIALTISKGYLELLRAALEAEEYGATRFFLDQQQVVVASLVKMTEAGGSIASLKNDMENAKQAFARQEANLAIAKEKANHAEQTTEHEKLHATEVTDLKSSHATEVTDLKSSHATEVTDLKSSHATEVTDLKSSHATEIAELNEELHRKEGELSSETSDKDRLRSEWIEKQRGLEEKINALQRQLDENRHQSE